ncbi:MAG TPA: OadG family protein [Candidatus Faecalibacterium faecipullorum]|uniref:OadG family protein n=1 Tax=Candidatus Faecalibacterium faecipullorum TaxID=2838578 RepID=A0A9D2S834_9FIRM|nr:OadG family protein [Candidatus Faecalibacterium faecipullorum]
MEGTFLTVPQALLVAFCGLLIVFIMLAALSGIMYLLSKALNAAPKQEAAGAPAAPTAPAAPAAPAKAPAGQTYAGQVALVGVDEKTAACLMAIVSEETNIPLDELVFRKIEAL